MSLAAGAPQQLQLLTERLKHGSYHADTIMESPCTFSLKNCVISKHSFESGFELLKTLWKRVTMMSTNCSRI